MPRATCLIAATARAATALACQGNVFALTSFDGTSQLTGSAKGTAK